MALKSATGRMKLLFTDNDFLLQTNNLKSEKAKKTKVAIENIFSFTKPTTLQIRLDKDIRFSFTRLMADF